MNPKILALIPARSGSKRVINKNMRLLGGWPLIKWTIQVAQKVPGICDILVSTDAEEIAEFSRGEGAMVPWIRSQDLASDNSHLSDVSIHAIDWYEKKYGAIDGLLLLQPTSPFRTQKTIQAAIDLFQKDMKHPVVAVKEAAEKPGWMLCEDEEYLRPFIGENLFKFQSQELATTYVLTGSLYLISPQYLRASRSFIGERNLPIFIESNIESIDIDTEWDFEIAEYCFDKYFNENK